MSDKIALFIDGIWNIENFISYNIESGIYTADDAFSIELANPEIDVKEGHRCELYVNDKLELTGIIDRVVKSYDKQGVKLKAEGRDLMGLLVDSYCEEFITLEGVKVKALAERLLKNVPFISLKDIEYQENFTGKIKSKNKSTADIFDTAQNFSQIEPGKTIFEVLSEYAKSRGMLFWNQPDGKFVFGKPKAKGDSIFSLICTKDGKGDNNILEGELTKDISKRYSKITVIGQQQGEDLFSAGQINTKAAVEDKDFPFYKPYATQNNNDEASPKKHANMILEQQKQQGFQLSCKVAGHSQNGQNWTVNELAWVKDEVLDIEGDYLIYSRTFELNKQGVFTSLKLGCPGAVQ